MIVPVAVILRAKRLSVSIAPPLITVELPLVAAFLKVTNASIFKACEVSAINLSVISKLEEDVPDLTIQENLLANWVY